MEVQLGSDQSWRRQLDQRSCQCCTFHVFLANEYEVVCIGSDADIVKFIFGFACLSGDENCNNIVLGVV